MSSILSFCDNFQALGKEGQKSLLRYGLSIFRESLLWKFTKEDLVKVQDEELGFIQNFSKVLNESRLEQLVGLFNKGYIYIERNANPKILFMDVSLQSAKIFATE